MGGASGGMGGTTGGTVGTGGTIGGTGGTAGVGGAVCQALPATCAANREALELSPLAGYVARSSNCAGVQGAVVAFADTVGSQISVTSANDDICVSGTAVHAVNGNFDSYWGAVVALELNNDGVGNLLPYNATSNGVGGFVLSLTGAGIPSDLRFRVAVSGQSTAYCAPLASNTLPQFVNLVDTHPQCWLGGDVTTPDRTRLERIELQIPSQAVADVPFNFCIKDLMAKLSTRDPYCSSQYAKSAVECTQDCSTSCGFSQLGSKVCACNGVSYSSCPCTPPVGWQGAANAGPCAALSGGTGLLAELDGKSCATQWQECVSADAPSGTTYRGCVCLPDPRCGGALHWSCGSTNKWFGP